MNIGEVIKRRRQKRNMTQAELGELLNVTPQAVSRWEMGISYPDIVIVPEISKALAVSADELLGISRPSEIDYGREAEQMTDRDGGAWPEPEGGKYADPILTQSQVDSIFDYMPCSATGKGRRVLITDDAEFLRTVVQGILSSKGHTVLQAKNGQECLGMDICFRCTENPEFLNNVQSATKGGGKNNFEGISGMLHKWFETPGMVIALCGYITIISRLNVLISAYLICAVGIHYAFLLAGKRYEHSKRDELAGNERRSKYLYDIMYDFSYGKEIRLYALSEWLGSQFMLYRDKIRTIKKSIKNYEMLVAWIDILLSFIREGIVYAYLVFMVLEGDMTIADFTMYVATIAGFRGAFERTIRQLADMHGLSMQISDYQSFMLWPDEMAEAEKPVPVPDGPYGNVSANSYEFEFRNVSWKYPGSNHYVFRNLNLTISKGQKLAIVGNNGAGKSTFIKLLLRLYDVTEGEILCNGINIRQFERRQYYDIFRQYFRKSSRWGSPWQIISV